MKKILGLTVAALMVMGLVGGGTWAYFSDTETSSGNTLVSGTLDVGLDNTDNDSATTSITSTWATSNWAPGTTKDATLYINNDGTIAISTLTVDFDYTSVSTAGRPTNIDGSPWTTDPEDYFDKMITATTATWKTVDVAAIKNKTLEYLKANGPFTLSGGLAGGTNEPLNIVFSFNGTATNGCQGNTVDVTVTVAGTQN